MKHFIVALILLIFYAYGFCQKQKMTFKKPSIDLSVLSRFSSAAGASISVDGNYVTYTINNPVMATYNCYVKSLKFNWTLNLGSVACEFTSDSKYLFFKKGNDSFALMQLENRQVEYISNVSSFKISNNGKWIAYCDKAKKLVIRNQETKREKLVEPAVGYFFDPSDSCVFIESNQPNGSRMLLLVNLTDFGTKPIWNAQGDEKSGNYIFSKDGEKLAFTVESKPNTALWLYEEGDNPAKEIAKQALKGIAPDFIFQGINSRGFTQDGNKLFITLKEKSLGNPNSKGVDVWSYTDTKLQSEQLKQLEPIELVGIILIQNDTLIQLEHPDEVLISHTNENAVMAKLMGDEGYDEWHWNKKINASTNLVSLSDGTRRLISTNLPSNIALCYKLSPTGKFIIYYEPDKRNYFSYEVATGIKRNITARINTIWTEYRKRDLPTAAYMPINDGAAGWMADDTALILYDQCDIYQVDPMGKMAPINLTNGFGRDHNIEFRLAMQSANHIFRANEKLIISAFNRINKNDGFYSIVLGKKRMLQLLTMQPCIFTGTWDDDRFSPSGFPKKAKDAEVYLVRRMSASKSPNYLGTNDFKSFFQITDVHPEESYNWLTTELITWKMSDGKKAQGILYKPENFNPQKKYPLIIHYYERFSEGLHGFIVPDFCHGDLNIPYFVSNGYLVFTPDIYYKVGHPGESVLNTIVSAANYLSSKGFVDAKHMGIEGHSRGGWETNYLVTHTRLFAAAVSACGFSNYVNLYNGIRTFRSGVSRQTAFENYFQRIGATLWERPDLYIENSPIFKADYVTTPVLMMANKEDDDVPFEQGVQFFTALRRLGKKAWLLQYDGEKHLVFGGAALDFTVRMKQFFDHYLMNAPAPMWMQKGIPAKLKGVNDGLELLQ